MTAEHQLTTHIDKRHTSQNERLRLPDVPAPPERLGSVMSCDEALTRAGISPDDYYISEHHGYWGTPSAEWVNPRQGPHEEGESWGEDRGSRPASADMVKKDIYDGRWEIGNRVKTGEDVVERPIVTVTKLGYRRYDKESVRASSVLDGIGVDEETQAAVQAEIDNRRAKADDVYEQRRIQYESELAAAYEQLLGGPLGKVLPIEYRERAWERHDRSQAFLEELRGWAEQILSLYERQEAGEILVNWQGWRHSGRGGMFVVDIQGEEIGPDVQKRRGSGVSKVCWNIVDPDQLAVSWTRSSSVEPFECRVAKLPAQGITPEQQAKLRDIEARLGMPIGSWETDEAIMAQRHATLEKILTDEELATFLQEVMATWDEPDRTEGRLYNMLMSSGGVIGKGDYHEESGSHDDDNSKYEADNRPATLLYKVDVSPSSAAVLLGYRKYGGWNHSLRLVEVKPVETSPEATAKTDELPAIEEGVDPVAALKAHFNSRR